MWPFKKHRRFVILLVNSGKYYTGRTDAPLWTGKIKNAMHLDSASADRITKAMAIRAIGGYSYGTIAIIED